MRKVLRILAVLILTLILALPLAAPVFAEEQGGQGEVGDGRIDVTSKFTDVNFRTEIYRVINKVQGDPIYDTDVAEIKELNVEYIGIRNLSGIEYFIGLEILNCSGNSLASLDVSKNIKLKELACYSNLLTKLDVSKNTKLTSLCCDDNQLTSLDVSKNTELKELTCSTNLLAKLDVSKNTKLTVLYCDNNKLTSLDASKNMALTKLACSFNQLNMLDVSKNTALAELICWSNQLTSLDVSKNTKLTYLDCDENQLSELYITTNTKLETLYCSDNQLTSLDVSNNTALKILSCSYNLMPLEPVGLENLNLDDYTFFPQYVDQANDISNRFADENFRAAIYEVLGQEPGSPIYDIDVADITELDVSGRGISTLAGIKYFVGLEVLNCSNNLLMELYLNHNTQLRELDCSHNLLELTGIESLSELEILNCSNNLLTELDLSFNTNLRELDCSHNRLKQPPTGIGNLQLDNYVFDPQDITNLTLYLLIGGVALLALAGGVVLIFVLKRKKKKAAPNEGTEPTAAPELADTPQSESWTSLWDESQQGLTQPLPVVGQGETDGEWEEIPEESETTD